MENIRNFEKYFAKIVLAESQLFSFSDSFTLKSHVQAVHEGIKSKKCDHCGKMCATTSQLKSHIAIVHEGQKNYHCELCGKASSTMNNLKKHIDAVHHGIKLPQTPKQKTPKETPNIPNMWFPGDHLMH